MFGLMVSICDNLSRYSFNLGKSRTGSLVRPVTGQNGVEWDELSLASVSRSTPHRIGLARGGLCYSLNLLLAPWCKGQPRRNLGLGSVIFLLGRPQQVVVSSEANWTTL